MPANVETMFSGRGIVPWHGLGEIVSGVLTSADAIRRAGLDWKVEKHPVFARIPAPGENPSDPAHGKFKRVDSMFATVRSKDHKTLGVVGSRYTCVQNADAFAALDGLVDNGTMTYETAGSLNGGSTVWMLGCAGEDWTIAGDKVRPYFLARLTHDGTGAIRFRNVATRVVCANTLAAAMLEARQGEVTIRHTFSADERLRQLGSLMGLVTKSKDAFIQTAEALLAQTFSRGEMESLIKTLFPVPEIKTATKREFHNWNERFDTIMRKAWGASDLNDVRFTAWGAVNAIADFEQHLVRVKGDPQTRRERRFEVALLNGQLTRKALEIVTAKS